MDVFSKSGPHSNFKLIILILNSYLKFLITEVFDGIRDEKYFLFKMCIFYGTHRMQCHIFFDKQKVLNEHECCCSNGGFVGCNYMQDVMHNIL